MAKSNLEKHAKLVSFRFLAFGIIFLLIFSIMRAALHERAVSEGLDLIGSELSHSIAELKARMDEHAGELGAKAESMHGSNSERFETAIRLLAALEAASNLTFAETVDSGQRLRNLEGFFDTMRQALELPVNDVRVNVEDLTELSGASEAQINLLLEGTGLHGAGWYFLEAERRHGVNAVIMAAIMRQESQLGSAGRLAQHNNFAGLSAHPTHPNMPAYGRWETWGTRREGVFALAYRLGNFYLHPGQRFFSRTYGPSVIGVNQFYARGRDGMASATWGPAVISHSMDFQKWIADGRNPSARAARYRATGHNPYVDESGVVRKIE